MEVNNADRGRQLTATDLPAIKSTMRTIIETSPLLLKHMASFLIVGAAITQLFKDVSPATFITITILSSTALLVFIIGLISSLPPIAFPYSYEPMDMLQSSVSFFALIPFMILTLRLNPNKGLGISSFFVHMILSMPAIQGSVKRRQYNPSEHQFEIATTDILWDTLVVICCTITLSSMSIAPPSWYTKSFWFCLVSLVIVIVAHVPYIGYAFIFKSQAEINLAYINYGNKRFQNASGESLWDMISEIQLPFAYVCAMVSCLMALASDETSMIVKILCPVQAIIVGFAQSHTPKRPIADPIKLSRGAKKLFNITETSSVRLSLPAMDLLNKIAVYSRSDSNCDKLSTAMDALNTIVNAGTSDNSPVTLGESTAVVYLIHAVLYSKISPAAAELVNAFITFNPEFAFAGDSNTERPNPLVSEPVRSSSHIPRPGNSISDNAVNISPEPNTTVAVDAEDPRSLHT